MRNPSARALVFATVGLLGACSASSSLEGLSAEDLGPDAPFEVSQQALAEGSLRLNDVYYVTQSTGFDGARMFSSATNSTVTRRIPLRAAVKIVIAEPSSGRYRVDHGGSLGWIAAADLTFHQAYDNTLSLTRVNALARARNAMGFSYWWSNARWDPSGATTWPKDNRGICVGACDGDRGCTHSASNDSEEYGSDCSGLVSTVWGFPDEDPDTNELNNGYQTKAYAKDGKHWKTVPLADALPGDALVRYDDVQHHIVLVASKRSGKKLLSTYECRGCANGCQAFFRKAVDGGPWHAIRQSGW